MFAIGTESASLEHISAITQAVKTYLYNCTNYNIPILYGGSVNENNIAEILSLKTVDGVLVGRAGLNVDSQIKWLKFANKLTTKKKIRKLMIKLNKKIALVVLDGYGLANQVIIMQLV